MTDKTLLKPALMALVIIVTVVTIYENYLRNQNVRISYDDGPAMWADQRAKADCLQDERVVFIGSSRIKFALDIPTWEKQTGLKAVQLAMVGSSPVPVLKDLGNDLNFKGKLIIDVTEFLFFSNMPQHSDTPNKNINYFHDQTPAQKAGFELNQMLESQLVILDKDNISLNAALDGLQIPSRKGVFMMPIFPLQFDRSTSDRQSYMTDAFLASPKEIHQVQGIWHFFGEMAKAAPPISEMEIVEILKTVKLATDKIKARGGKVLFLRTPSSGPLAQGEKMGFPKEKFWARLLNETHCYGIHYEDYLGLNGFVCPEFSHLKLQDATVFTKNLTAILSEKKVWTAPSFKNKNNLKL